MIFFVHKKYVQSMGSQALGSCLVESIEFVSHLRPHATKCLFDQDFCTLLRYTADALFSFPDHIYEGYQLLVGQAVQLHCKIVCILCIMICHRRKKIDRYVFSDPLQISVSHSGASFSSSAMSWSESVLAISYFYYHARVITCRIRHKGTKKKWSEIFQ